MFLPCEPASGLHRSLLCPLTRSQVHGEDACVLLLLGTMSKAALTQADSYRLAFNNTVEQEWHTDTNSSPCTMLKWTGFGNEQEPT